MTKTICIIDYTPTEDTLFRFRGKRLAKIIDEFFVNNQNPFRAEFFSHAKELRGKLEENNERTLSFSPYLVLLHRSNEFLDNDRSHYRYLVDYCRDKKIPIIIFTGASPGPDEVNLTRLRCRMERILKALRNIEKKDSIEKSIRDIVSEKSLQDEILRHYANYIKPQFFMLNLTMQGFLLIHGDQQWDKNLPEGKIIDKQAIASASNWNWFLPLLSPEQNHQGGDEDFTGYCRLFTSPFDLKLSEFYCLFLGDKSRIPDENLQGSLEQAFGQEEKEKVCAINHITGHEYKDLNEIYQTQTSIGKMLKKNACRYSIPVLLNPQSPPLAPTEKKYLDSFRIIDGEFKTTFLNLWSNEVKVSLPQHVENQINTTLRHFVYEIYKNRKFIREAKKIEDLEGLKLKIKEVHATLSRIIKYFENELGEYRCNT